MTGVQTCALPIYIVGIPVDMPKDEIAKIFADTGYSRLPVYEENIDQIIGILYQKDFYNFIYRSDVTIRDSVRPVIFTPKNKKIDDLLRELQQKKLHIAVAMDEYGGTAGIVTLEDVIEELVGEIWDEHDEVIDEIVKISENKYRILGKANLGKMFDLFEMDDEFDVITVGGWIVEFLDRVPDVGESFDFENLTITITQGDERHVIEINVVKNEIISPEN